MRILLVEDDPDLSRALQSGLERQGVVAWPKRPSRCANRCTS